MCGRFVSVSSPDLMAERFDVDEQLVEEHEADYNVTPRSEVYVVRDRPGHGRQLALLRWGLVPSWAESPSIGDRLINARRETLLEKPAFRNLLAKKRCIVPADGFYEWKREGRHKQPMFIRRRDGEPLAFAGLWSAWKDRDAPADDWMRSCTIVTTDAQGAVRPIHDRMPLMLPESSWPVWLDTSVTDVDEIRAVMINIAIDELEIYPVSSLVNKPANNGPQLVERAEPETLFG